MESSSDNGRDLNLHPQGEAPDRGRVEGEEPGVGMFQEEERGLEGDACLPEGKSHMHHPRWG